jgi:hypothetical protein
MNLLGIIAILSSIFGFHVSHRYFKNKPARLRLTGCAVLGALAIPSILFAVYYLHLLPERAWLYTLRSWLGSELLAVFLGGAGGALAALLPRFLLVIPLGLTIITASLPYLKMTMYPLKAAELNDQWEGDACLQSTASTCGPASLASILRFLGQSSSEREIAAAAHSTSTGTEAWYLARHACSCGFTPAFDFRDTFTPTIPLPAIVGVRFGSSGHFIAVLQNNGGLITIVDPLNGKRELKLADFMKFYTFTGFHMSVKQENGADL